MGKTFERKPPRTDRPLAQRPMAGAFKGIRVGPECLECKGPVDARPAFSFSGPTAGKGSRKTQRHGYLHPDCELEAMKRYSTAQGKEVQSVRTVQGPKGNLVQVSTQPGVTMQVPVYGEEEIQEILAGKGVGA